MNLVWPSYESLLSAQSLLLPGLVMAQRVLHVGKIVERLQSLHDLQSLYQTFYCTVSARSADIVPLTLLF